MTTFRIATFVSDHRPYAEMRRSFESAGFVEPHATYTIEEGEPYAAITRLGAVEEPYVVLVHQDVVADQGDGIERLTAALDWLTAHDPTWAVAGNAGIDRDGRAVRHLADKYGTDWRDDLPRRVQTLDENFLVLRTAMHPRCSSGLSGFHLYGADVCLNAEADGASAYVIDFRVTHNGEGDMTGFADSADRFGARWWRARQRPRYVTTTVARVPVAPSHAARRALGSPRIRRAFEIARNVAAGVGAARRVRQAPADLDAAIDYAFAFRHGPIDIAPIQVRSELERFLAQIGRPRRVVELGTATGGMLFLLTRVAAEDATILSVDLPRGGRFGGGYPRTRVPLLRAFAQHDQKIHLVRADSQRPETARRVARLLGGHADVLLIDADHSYDGVRRDYELYRGLVAPGGLIAFHDIVPGREADVGGVPRFWEELKASGVETIEIVEDWGQGGWGLGLMRAG